MAINQPPHDIAGELRMQARANALRHVLAITKAEHDRANPTDFMDLWQIFDRHERDEYEALVCRWKIEHGL
jgi:hypothetical protein